MMDQKSSRKKVVLQGMTLSYASTMADPILLLPLIISYFSDNYLLVGVFIALYKVSGMLVQLYSAYRMQSKLYVMSDLKAIFLLRLFSWLLIGTSIVFFGKEYPNLTLVLMAIGLTLYSISYSMGALHYNEILAKVFTRKYRGVTLAYRQLYAAFGLLVAAFSVNYIIDIYEEPVSFGMLFIYGSFVMAIGLYYFTKIVEPKKEHLRDDRTFTIFLSNSISFLKSDTIFQKYLLSYILVSTYLLAMPYIIIQSKEYFEFTGLFVAELILIQGFGFIVGNLLWGLFSFKSKEKYILLVSIIMLMVIMLIMLNLHHSYYLYIVFFLYAFASDGIKLVYNNILLVIAPEEKRPIYTSLKSHITSLGFLFPIIGGLIIYASSSEILYYVTLSILSISFIYVLLNSEY